MILLCCALIYFSRFWQFNAEGVDASSPSLKCIKVFQMPQEHGESQILTCAYSSAHNILAVGLFNGSLHVADLTDTSLSIHNT